MDFKNPGFRHCMRAAMSRQHLYCGGGAWVGTAVRGEDEDEEDEQKEEEEEEEDGSVRIEIHRVYAAVVAGSVT